MRNHLGWLSWAFILFPFLCVAAQDAPPSAEAFFKSAGETLSNDVRSEELDPVKAPTYAASHASYSNPNENKTYKKEMVFSEGVPSFTIKGRDVTLNQPMAAADQRRVYRSPAPDYQASGNNIGRYQDGWFAGTNELGAGYEYLMTADREGNSSASASLIGKVYDKRGAIIGMSASTTRVYHGQGIQDDVVRFDVDYSLAGNVAKLTTGTIGINQKLNVPANTYRQTFFERKFLIYVAGLPVWISLGLTGTLSSGELVGNFSQVPNTAVELSYLFDIKPYAGVSAYGSASISPGDYPTDVKPTDVGVGVDVEVIRATVYAGAFGSTNTSSPCFTAYLDRFQSLKGRLRSWVRYNELQIIYYRWVIDRICEGDVGDLINNVTGGSCREARRLAETVTDWVSFQGDRTLLNWSGYSWGDRVDLVKNNSCKVPVKDTVVVLRNTFNRDIFTSIGYYRPETGTWASKGWFRVPAEGEFPVSLGNYRAGYVYLYGEYDGGNYRWVPDTNDAASFCVDRRNAFDINKSDSSECNPVTSKRSKFFKLTINPETTGPFTFNSYQDKAMDFCVCNSTSQKTIWASVAKTVDGNWMSYGWIQIPKGQCPAVASGLPGSIYIHATRNTTQPSTEWSETTHNLCVHPTKGYSINLRTDGSCAAEYVPRGFKTWSANVCYHLFD